MANSLPQKPYEEIRVLILEDNPYDAELVLSHLRDAGFVFTSKLVDSKKAYAKAFQEFSPDLILSDYNLPSFSGTEALEIKKRVSPEIPFILVTGAVGEELAIKMLTNGATDYIFKKNLTRLLPAVTRALHEAYEHRKRQEAEAERDRLLKELENRVKARTKALHKQIKKRKETESALKASEVKYSDLVKDAPAAIYEADFRSRKFLTVNDFMCEVTGYSKDELLNMDFMDLMDDKSKPNFLKRSRTIFAGEKPNETVEYKIRAKDGRELYAFLNEKFVTDENGNIKGARVVGTNLTEHKRIETALKESEKSFRTIFEKAPLGIALIDTQTSRFLEINPKFCEIMGRSEQEMRKLDFQTLTHPDDLAASLENIQKLIEGEVPFFNMEKRYIRSDGTITWVNVTAVALWIDGEIPSRHITMVEDINERKRAEETREHLISELEKRNKEMESFSYSVSHDLHAPLRAIDGFSSMLRKTLDNKLDLEEGRRFNLIRDNIKKMNHLIDDLLALSRIGRTEILKRTIDMKHIAQSAWQQQQNANPGFTIEVKIGSLPEALGDASLLFQVFSNLLSNAFKYTRKRKRPLIELGGQSNGNEVIYYVKDNGIGFSMKFYDKLFGVFQRLHSESEYEGTGVGLAIVQRIVDRHGGRVWAEGKVGKGAAFYFSLPNH